MIKFAKISLVLGLFVAAAGCSAGVDTGSELESAEDISDFEQAFTETACATNVQNATINAFGAFASPPSNISPNSYGNASCTQAWTILPNVSGVVNSRVSVKPAVFPTPAQCTTNVLKVRIWRNSVLQRNFSKAGTLSGGICTQPTFSEIFKFGDGADWRIVVQDKQGATLKAVSTTLNNQGS